MFGLRDSPAAPPPTSRRRRPTIVRQQLCNRRLGWCSAVLIITSLLATACGGGDTGAVPADAPAEFDEALELAISLDRGRTDESRLRDDMWGLTAAYCTNINADSVSPQSQQVQAILAFVESNVCPQKSNAYWGEAFLALESGS